MATIIIITHKKMEVERITVNDVNLDDASIRAVLTARVYEAAKLAKQLDSVRENGNKKKDGFTKHHS